MSLSALSLGQAGLNAFSQELDLISHNVDNLSTIGFKGSQAQFAELFAAGNGNGAGGQGVRLATPQINFAAGTSEQTDNPLDLMVDGNGYFILKDANGQMTYTRDGSFMFNDGGVLVSKTDPTQKVMGFDSSGNLKEITTQGSRISAAAASTTVTWTQQSTLVTDVSSTITVYDSAGSSHTLTLAFTPDMTATSTERWRHWLLTVSEGNTTVQSNIALSFDTSGNLTLSPSPISYNPPGAAAQTLTINFGSLFKAGQASSSSTSSSSSTPPTSQGFTGVVAAVDGHGTGTIATQAFDADGNLKLNYSNGDSKNLAALALATFSSTNSLRQTSAGRFTADDPNVVQVDRVGARAGHLILQTLEKSNVDLTKAFSDMILTQRGYQACSEVVTAVNDMLKQLMQMGSGGA